MVEGRPDRPGQVKGRDVNENVSEMFGMSRKVMRYSRDPTVAVVLPARSHAVSIPQEVEIRSMGLALELWSDVNSPMLP